MSTDRLLGSYVVRVVVRNGVRSILLHDLATSATTSFRDFGALAEHLEGAAGRREDGGGRAAGPGRSP